MRVKIKVVLETADGDTTEVVTSDARDIRGWESEFAQSFLTTDLSYTQLTQLAWMSMKRLKKFDGSYDTFDSQCVEVESADDEDEEPEPGRPTQKAPGGGRSSR